MASHHLTKSRNIAGLQCPRRLWLVVHEPLPYEEPTPGSPLEVGYEIGVMARLLPRRCACRRGPMVEVHRALVQLAAT
jgi:hypothetical protein